MNKPSRVYRVEFTTIVDRPDLRGGTYPQVAPGTPVATSRTFDNQRAALALFEDLTSGGWDLASEYIARASVVEPRLTSSPRFVRKTVERTRAVRA